MLSYANKDRLILQSDPAIADQLTSLTVLRNSAVPLAFGIVADDGSGTLLDLGDTPGAVQFKVIVKSATGDQRYDQAATLVTTAFTKTGSGSTTLYVGTLNISGPLIDKALGVDNISQPETVQITCTGDSANSLRGRHFVLFDQNGPVWIWFKVGGTGTAPVTPAGFSGRLLEVDIATDAAASAVAAQVSTAFSADAQLTASASSTVVTFVDKFDGYRNNATPDNTGFLVTITQAGADAFTQADLPVWNALLQFQFNTGSGWQICQAVSLTVQNNLDRDDTPAAPLFSSSIQSGEADVPLGASSVTVAFPVPYSSPPRVILAGPLRKLSPTDPTPPLVEDQTSKTASAITFDFTASAPAAAKLPWLAIP